MGDRDTGMARPDTRKIGGLKKKRKKEEEKRKKRKKREGKKEMGMAIENKKQHFSH